MKHIARYSVNFGLEGCYMPDSYSGPVECSTRRELADFIRGEIDFYGMPKSMFREVKIKNLWNFIKRNGSSVAHFNLFHGGNALRFNGLTQSEFEEMESQND